MKTLNFLFVLLTVLLFEGVISGYYGPIYELEEWRQTHPALASLIPIREKDDKSFGGRVTNGIEVVPHSFPFQAGLNLKIGDNKGFCGGSLISLTTVLTAAHCIDESSGEVIILGAHKINENEPEQLKIVPTSKTVHNLYDSAKLSNDIALLRFLAVLFTEAIQPVALPPLSRQLDPFIAQIATVTGWGRVSDNSFEISSVLRKASNSIMVNLLCALRFGFDVPSSQICVSGDGGRSSCNGDSGGPLVINLNDVLVLVGVVSYGVDAGCEKGLPSVYTRVTSYSKWISDNSDAVFPKM